MSAATESQQIEDAFNSLSLRDAKDDLANCVRRPDFGRQGKKIPVSANMFPVTFGKSDMVVYHYDIDIDIQSTLRSRDSNGGQKQYKELKWKIWKELCATAPEGAIKEGLAGAAFDRERNFYATFKLPLSRAVANLKVELKDEEGQTPTQRGRQNRIFNAKVQFAREIDLNVILSYCQGQAFDPDTRDMVAMGKAAINTLLRQDLYDRFVPKGGQGRRSFTLDDAVPMSGAGSVLNGFIQSFIPSQSGFPAVQLDTAYGPFFRSGNLLEIVTEIFMGDGNGSGGRGGRGGRGGPRGRGGFGPGLGNSSARLADILSRRYSHEKLKKLFWGAKYTLTYRATTRPFRIEGFTTETAAQIRFEINEHNSPQKKMVSAVEYFKSLYNLTIRHPDLPMIVTGKNRGRKLIPMEFVQLTEFNGIPFTAVSSTQTAEMIKVAAKAPADRRKKIMGWRAKLDYSRLPKIRDWCLEVSPDMMRLQARILDPPKVNYKGRAVTPINGAWNLNDNKFVKANKPLSAWSILCFDRYLDDGGIKSVMGQLMSTLSRNDCNVQGREPPIHRGDLTNLVASLSAAANLASKYGGNVYPQLIVIVVPSKESGLYQAIKRIATNELTKPVVTQIMLSARFKIERGLSMYLSNVSMKIHSKLGGVTHAVPIPSSIDKTTMLIGADVTHPPPAGKDKALLPSIAVSVAAVNGDNNMFRPCVRLQPGRREMIDDLTSMIKDHIKLFEKRTGFKPQKILFFRDGVSEGQYDLCATIEMDRVKQAFKELDPKYNPKITLVICAKRHHMRFFAEDRRDTDKTGNLLAGTVVDTDVTHPFAFDFYLQSHAGLQGTARPTHYVVVIDENNFTADRMQGLCNDLCYSYARSSRAVSLVPVVYYADLIAWKARDFVYPPDDNSDTASVATGSSVTVQASFDPQQLCK
ncbi:hypothetical protein L486_03296 [Kwoniella mangroviensis CBS 10435]|uniref:Argonaute n=1 Tax=Kwoniella mangroviensis CBS 10435 TaxID=1331196 RepID=A0A1B9ITE7_9TREE|nr:hypothetical protein L486_03296 [Kwoniella mangroviensis CBS 10435]